MLGEWSDYVSATLRLQELKWTSVSGEEIAWKRAEPVRTGEKRPIWSTVARCRGLNFLFACFPRANARGFMLSPASQA